MLNYIDDANLRISVRTALNRGEAYHQLKRTISSINSDSLTGTDDDDITVNDECTRLLSLVVIYYNAHILSEVVKIKKREGKMDELEKFKHISPVAWLHIIFHGYYNFDSQLTKSLLDEMIKKLAEEAKITD